MVRFEDTNEGAALDTSSLQPQNARAEAYKIGSDVLIYAAVGAGRQLRPAGEDARKGETRAEGRHARKAI